MASNLNPLPLLLDVGSIQNRLKQIFPEGSANRAVCTREMAARTIFAMLYVGAVEGAGGWLAPKQVYLMGESQAAKQSFQERAEYARSSAAPGYRPKTKRWYADNSREPIRDETIRNGFVLAGAIIQKPGVPTTSPAPRYALAVDFAGLFSPALTGSDFQRAAEEWRKKHLSAGALARVRLMDRGKFAGATKVKVQLPNGEVRLMEPGKSSLITKDVVEVFASTFLLNPAVLWISESGNKVVARDDQLAKQVGIEIDPSKTLPDVILIDLKEDPELFFVEVVATSGIITEGRKAELKRLVPQFAESQIKFITAFEDRESAVFKRSIAHLAWGTLAWLVSEPDHLIRLNGS